MLEMSIKIRNDKRLNFQISDFIWRMVKVTEPFFFFFFFVLIVTESILFQKGPLIRPISLSLKVVFK